MEYDIDYEINKYIDEQADQYIEFDELLKQNHITFDIAKQKVKQFKENFYCLLSKYSISCQNLTATCYDLMEHINKHPDNADLQHLYFCVMTDFGLLNEINSHDRTKEQEIRNYFHQNELVQKLTAFLKSQSDNSKKFNKIQEYLKKPIQSKHVECMQEADLLYNLTIHHTFLYSSSNNKIYHDNLDSLLTHINSDDILKSVKPYAIFAVLSKKHGMMNNRVDFIPNFKTIFQYQTYNIMTDNGKNFNNYQSYVELYEHLRRFYIDDKEVDIELSDFCFANLSPLSEWYYIWCEQNEEIPMNLRRKVYSLKPMSFPMISNYDDYGDFDISEFQTKYSEIYKLWGKAVTPDTTEEFLQIIRNNSDISKSAEKLPYGKEFPQYAEIFMYQSAEILLEEKMLRTAEKFINCTNLL